MKRAFLLKMQRTTDLKLFLYQNTLTLPKNFRLLLIFFQKRVKKQVKYKAFALTVLKHL